MGDPIRGNSKEEGSSQSHSDRREGEALTALFSCLASNLRRHVLGLLYTEAPASVTREELAVSLAAENHGKSREQVTAEERQQALTALDHVHVPQLEDAGLIEQDTEGDTVTLADHPAFQDVGIRAVITGDARADSDSLDALFAALADPRRRAILDVLSRQYQPIQTETLAREVGAREQGTSARDVTPEDIEQIFMSFRLIHLLKLSEADLIDYNIDEQTVAYAGHPDLRVPWLHTESSPDFRASSTDEDVWTIEG